METMPFPKVLSDILHMFANEAGGNRKAFNKMVKDTFTHLGSGAFRMCYDTGMGYVVKIRRAKPSSHNPFPMNFINEANQAERDGFVNVSSEWKNLGHFVLEPYYISLPNGHDIIIMKKVEYIVGDNGENEDWMKENPLLFNMMQMLQDTFRDAHLNNLGVLDGRVYLIDVNFSNIFSMADMDREDTDSAAGDMLKRQSSAIAA
jgi:hypothetical protein